MKIKVSSMKRTLAPVAMADIAFLLLIFLILTVSSTESGEIELPRFRYIEKTGFSIVADLTIYEDGRLLIDGQPFEVSEAADALSGYRMDTVIRIHADRDLEYIRLDEVLSVLRSAGRNQLVLMADRVEE
jgi:biopolymer transport protein ExbD